ncbi:hypothetical protein M8C21_031984 [Ambrosia artemisiifolia]|uniref:Uncharacterized protein n=1 Tax=Ambrosia artemisiifolia TaxID=4212 RepID=A0AAD5D903_AMBAR|nr:hypothetical protein M8C21_031984 [Ambrosia artemisiifolia]
MAAANIEHDLSRLCMCTLGRDKGYKCYGYLKAAATWEVDGTQSSTGAPSSMYLLSDNRISWEVNYYIFMAWGDYGHVELLLATNAVMNPVYALSKPFWKQMDPHSGFVSDASVSYLKQEVSDYFQT